MTAGIVERVAKLGGVEQTRSLARRYRAKAEKTLRALPDSPRRRSLGAVLDKIGKRKY